MQAQTLEALPGLRICWRPQLSACTSRASTLLNRTVLEFFSGLIEVIESFSPFSDLNRRPRWYVTQVNVSVCMNAHTSCCIGRWTAACGIRGCFI